MIEKVGTIKNPLTIIAIFAVIAEISGTVVLPFINVEHQELYIWFLIIFPLVLVITFFLTLNFNHKILYAPSDYRDEDNFIKSLQKESIIEKARKIKTTTMEKAAEPPIKANEEEDRTTKEEEVQEQNWWPKTTTAFDEGRVDDAKDIFNDYALKEQDSLKLQWNKTLFLYLLFTEGKDNSAIEQLENLANASTNDKSKYKTLKWLSFCLRDGSQTDKEIEIWRKSINSFRSGNIITNASVDLAYALDRAGNVREAKDLLVSRLESVSTSEEKAKIYSALSQIEKSLGNNRLAIYCKDKSLELDPNNRDELFNAAYNASKEGVDDLSISNYITLLRIDENNSIALNNLGVQAKEADLQLKAVEKYKKASSYDNTLAMANQGFLLVNSGFLEEAEVIAKKALQMENPHENVHLLFTRISKLKKEQDEKWDKLISKSMERQKFIRNYTHAYYEGDNKNFDGDWETGNGNTITINVKEDELDATWQEHSGILSSEKYNVTLTGKVNNSAFLGQYKKIKESEQSRRTTLLGLGLSSNRDIACVGILSTDGSVFTLISENHKDDFSLALKRKNA